MFSTAFQTVQELFQFALIGGHGKVKAMDTIFCGHVKVRSCLISLALFPVDAFCQHDSQNNVMSYFCFDLLLHISNGEKHPDAHQAIANQPVIAKNDSCYRKCKSKAG